MSSLARMLSILDLFGAESPVLSAEEIIATRKTSRPTGYRYVRELVASGLLVRADGGYSLGPRIIELDWLIRRHDPVLTRSRDVVRDLVSRSGCGVTQMGIYGDRIVTIHHERGPEALEIGFDRGRPMPLFRGAPSRAIVAFLPRARLQRLFERHRDELSAEQKKRGFERFYDEMQAVRREGYALSLGELDADKVGLAAPVFRRERVVAGSLCLVLSRTRYETANAPLLVARLTEAAAAISAVLEPADADARPRRRISPPPTRIPTS
jgi:DNA-binding IclR family transcriptional regulator